MKRILLIVYFCILSLCILPLSAQKTYHVNINNGNDSNDGLKWSMAFKNLQTAIDSAKAGDAIWVAAGTYHPTQKIAEVYGSNGNQSKPTGDRHRSFLIRKDVKIYGGFPAVPTDATSMSSRNWTENQTILSGDFNEDDGDNFENTEENAHHVVVIFDATPATVLDGLFITGGYANDVATTYVNGRTFYATGTDGGGIYSFSLLKESSPTISNVSFYGNYAKLAGGAMFNYSEADNASPNMSNISIIHNKAEDRHGGGFFNRGRTVKAELTNVNVVGNESALSGGGLYFVAIEECSPQIINTVVNGNYSQGGNGGGIYISTYDGDARPTILNVSICGNKAGISELYDGGGIVILPERVSKANIVNTVIWGNKGNDYDNFYAAGKLGSENIITGSLIEGSDDLGDTNLPGNTDPKFLEAVSADFAPTMDGDYQLTLESPLINKGLNDQVSTSVDLLGNSRIHGGTVDIGAYESQGKDPVGNETLIDEKMIWSYEGNVYVNIREAATTLRIYSLNGTLVRHIDNLGEGMYMYALPQGLYFVTLSNGITEKVFVR